MRIALIRSGDNSRVFQVGFRDTTDDNRVVHNGRRSPRAYSIRCTKNRVPLTRTRGFAGAQTDQLSDFTWPIISDTTPCAEP